MMMQTFSRLETDGTKDRIVVEIVLPEQVHDEEYRNDLIRGALRGANNAIHEVISKHLQNKP